MNGNGAEADKSKTAGQLGVEKGEGAANAPYLSTEVGTYKMYWRLADYLDVLTVLAGHSFVYFTSNKSSILELCDWIGRSKAVCNPFEKCTKVEFNAHMNYNATYTDMMLYKKAG